MPDLEELERRIKRIEDRLDIVDKFPYKFEELISNLDHRTWEQIWQGMDTREITLALLGLSRDQLLEIKPTLSKARWNEILKELSAPFTQDATQHTIQLFREEILKRILKLESRGEIVVARGDGKDYVQLDLDRKEKPVEPPFDVQSWLHSTFEKV